MPSNGHFGTALVEYLTGVQGHRAVPELGEFMLDFIVLHRAVLRAAPPPARECHSGGTVVLTD
jgi:hypothetical protein